MLNCQLIITIILSISSALCICSHVNTSLRRRKNTLMSSSLIRSHDTNEHDPGPSSFSTDSRDWPADSSADKRRKEKGNVIAFIGERDVQLKTCVNQSHTLLCAEHNFGSVLHCKANTKLILLTLPLLSINGKINITNPYQTL